MDNANSMDLQWNKTPRDKTRLKRNLHQCACENAWRCVWGYEWVYGGVFGTLCVYGSVCRRVHGDCMEVSVCEVTFSFCLLVVVLHPINPINIDRHFRTVPTCGSMPSWWLYSSVPLGNQATSTMTWPWPLSHIILTLSQTVLVLIMPGVWRLARKRHMSVLNSLVWLDQRSNHRGPKWATDALLIRPSHLLVCALMVYLMVSVWGDRSVWRWLPGNV